MDNESEYQKLMQAIREGYLIPERSGEYWSKEEREELAALYQEGTGLSSIAIALQRTEMAIFQQLLALGLMTATGNGRSRGPNKPHCLCRNCQLNATCMRGRERYA